MFRNKQLGQVLLPMVEDALDLINFYFLEWGEGEGLSQEELNLKLCLAEGFGIKEMLLV